MTNKQKEAIKNWIKYEKQNKDKINKADELIEIQEIILHLIQEQEMMINKMTEYIKENAEKELNICINQYPLGCEGFFPEISCEDCIIDYFERKIKHEKL